MPCGENLTTGWMDDETKRTLTFRKRGILAQLVAAQLNPDNDEPEWSPACQLCCGNYTDDSSHFTECSASDAQWRAAIAETYLAERCQATAAEDADRLEARARRAETLVREGMNHATHHAPSKYGPKPRRRHGKLDLSPAEKRDINDHIRITLIKATTKVWASRTRALTDLGKRRKRLRRGTSG